MSVPKARLKERVQKLGGFTFGIRLADSATQLVASSELVRNPQKYLRFFSAANSIYANHSELLQHYFPLKERTSASVKDKPKRKKRTASKAKIEE